MTTRQSRCNCGQLSVTYRGPDPERITLCQCYECQRRTGSVFSVQARLPIEHVTIEGQSTTWTFPEESGKPATFRSCDSSGLTYHFCSRCGSTLFWEFAHLPDFYGVAVGGFTDPTFPTPIGSGFEAYGAAWAMNIPALAIPHYDYEGPGTAR
jgi:hypothetical protein